MLSDLESVWLACLLALITRHVSPPIPVGGRESERRMSEEHRVRFVTGRKKGQQSLWQIVYGQPHPRSGDSPTCPVVRCGRQMRLTKTGAKTAEWLCTKRGCRGMRPAYRPKPAAGGTV